MRIREIVLIVHSASHSDGVVVPREWMKMSGGKKEKFAFNREKLNKYMAQVCKSYRTSTRRKSNVIHLACNDFAAGELCESA